MRKLITDLLDLTKIESGEKKRERKTVDINLLAQKSIDSLSQLAIEKSIEIKFSSKELPPLEVDPDEIEIILNNLISNAIKYNVKNGKVDVIINYQGDKLIIEIKDTGIGMNEEESRKIFNDFIRIKNEKTKNIAGSGLGLSIVKKISSYYGGTIDVTSKPGSGSRFKVILVLKKRPITFHTNVFL